MFRRRGNATEKIIRLSLVLVFIFCTMAVPGGEAVFLELTPEQIQEAIELGKKSLEERIEKGVATDEDDPEWTVDLGEGKGKAYLRSLFERVYYQTRHYGAIQMELPQSEINNIFFIGKEKLIFEAVIYGKHLFFAKKHKAHLEIGGEKIETVWQDIFKAIPSGLEDPELAFKATYIAHFPVENIDPQSQVTLVISDREGKETRFPFDLSKMR